MQLFDEQNKPTKKFYIFMRYGRLNDVEPKLSEKEEVLYQELYSKWSLLLSQAEKNEENAKTTLGAIMNMFGYSRHYCSVSGVPIIGPYFKLGGRIVCRDVYEAHQIFQQMENGLADEKKVERAKLNKPAKGPSKKEVKRA